MAWVAGLGVADLVELLAGGAAMERLRRDRARAVLRAVRRGPARRRARGPGAPVGEHARNLE